MIGKLGRKKARKGERGRVREIIGGVERCLLNIQVILLDGFEAVQSQIIVRLTEHSDLPQLKLFTLISQTYIQ